MTRRGPGMTRQRSGPSPGAPFVALLGSYVISVAGTSMSAIAIPWLVLTTTGSAARTGLAGFAGMAPYVVTLALAGPLVDRVGPRRSFVWGNLVAALAVGAVPVTYAAGGLSLPVLLALVAVAGADTRGRTRRPAAARCAPATAAASTRPAARPSRAPAPSGHFP
jgi:MFS family permease